MTLQLHHLCPRRHLPHTHRLILRSRDNTCPIPTPAHRIDTTSMTFQRHNLCPRGHLPHTHRTIVRSRDNTCPIRTPAHRCHRIGVTRKNGQQCIEIVVAAHDPATNVTRQRQRRRGVVVSNSSRKRCFYHHGLGSLAHDAVLGLC